MVARRLRGGVAGEVLEGGDDAGRLQPAHVRGADRRRRGTGPRRASPRRGPSGSRAPRRAPAPAPGGRRRRACSRRSRASSARRAPGRRSRPTPARSGRRSRWKAVNPVRHSSCAIAGMPRRVRSTRSLLQPGEPARALDRIDRLGPERPGEVPQPVGAGLLERERIARTPPAAAPRCRSPGSRRPTRCRAGRASRRIVISPSSDSTRSAIGRDVSVHGRIALHRVTAARGRQAPFGYPGPAAPALLHARRRNGQDLGPAGNLTG